MEKFKDIINGNQPVLVDFYAEWCGPCKAMAPAVGQVGKAVQGKARVLKIDIDKNPAIAQQLQIQAVPTLAIFKQGKIVWRHSGMLDARSMQNKLLEFA